jgi:selenide,water dikinase
MRRLNAAAAAVAREAGAVAATDVTGFGLVGHLHRMARASGVAARIDLAALPLLPGVEDLLAGGYVPGGTGRNLDYVAPALRWARPGDAERWSPLVADPQTSGGLLLACPPSEADAAVTALVADGHAAARIGALVEGPAGEVHLA